ncbi:MAG: 4Fe-4S dicluster domain-containing protein [Gemmatimonadales bacterium]|nr:4Fe-4S dicluster domain-containing protein [Gemmatimonadota bacterium]MBP6443459.1 4Fe-4S dicluster domain-containing protein [Gemmatimonadales bacterium]MBP6570729.1 4Fe-4S dicluster domain-containing protein [Gemmatimonadales bacterium]
MPMSARWTKTRSTITPTLPVDGDRVRLLGRGLVVAEPGRCVQCGICSQNCPSGIDVRAVAREGRAVTDRRCLLCGSCVTRCPRGTLSFQLLEAP